ncbi:MAG: hypothetical protein L0211_04670 [Planctomycetaceae bacterium]|nr:hypothetical protein [Planctomycetaceae bacterium]
MLFLIEDRAAKSWKPASFGRESIELATVWIDKDRCYAKLQIRNPGLVRLTALYGLEEKQLKEKVAAVR